MIGSQIPESVITSPFGARRPQTKKARDRYCGRGPVRSGNVVELRLRCSAGARHRRRWASLRGPQPALVARALEAARHRYPLYDTAQPIAIGVMKDPGPRRHLELRVLLVREALVLVH